MMPTVNAFNQIYNKLLDEHHSGWSDDQLKEHAREIFYQNHKKRFNYEHVWVILKNDPKWRATAPLSMSSKRAKDDESGAYTISSNAETNDDEVRPIRQKAAKAQLKRKRKAKETAKKGAEDWWGMWNDFLETQKEKIAAAQKLSDATKKNWLWNIYKGYI